MRGARIGLSHPPTSSGGKLSVAKAAPEATHLLGRVHGNTAGASPGSHGFPAATTSMARMTRLPVAEAHDDAEREADLIADRVLRMSAPSAPALPESNASADGTAASVPSLSGGEPLRDAERGFFEPRFGHDFAQVRIHADEQASRTARGVRALAFALGDHIFFGAGRYAPGTQDGRTLLAHELAHVIQHATSRSSGQVIRRKPAPEPEPEDESSWLPDIWSWLPAWSSAEAQQRKPAEPAEDASEHVDEDVPAEPTRFAKHFVRKTREPCYVFDKTDLGKYTMRRQWVITDDVSYLRDAHDLTQFLDPGASPLPTGVTIRKGRVALPRGAVTRIAERTVSGTTYCEVGWSGERGWTHCGNLKGPPVTIPPGTLVEVLERNDAYVRVRWDSDEGWAVAKKIEAQYFDLTYATRFASADKRGLETSVPKETRIRFEEDGTLLLGRVVAKQANRRAAEDHSKVLSEVLPRVDCIVLETSGSYLRVLDYAGTWNLNGDPPGWWTKASNVETRRGRPGPEEIANPAVRAYVPESPGLTAADVDIRVSELEAAARIVGRVTTSAAIRDSEGQPLGPKLAPGLVVVLEAKPLAGNDATPTITRVLPLIASGASAAQWVDSRTVSVNKSSSQAGYSIEETDSGPVLVMRVNPNAEATQGDRYPITPAVAAELKAAYRRNVEALIAGKAHSANQKALLERARSFALNPPSGGADLAVPDSALRDTNGPDDGVRLNPDLVRRMQTFYKFLTAEGLVTGPPAGFGGVRAKTVAHILSTKWTLNPKSGWLKTAERRLLFARRLASLGGQPDVSQATWLAPDLTPVLLEAVRLANDAQAYRSSHLFGGRLAVLVAEGRIQEWVDTVLRAPVAAEPVPTEAAQPSTGAQTLTPEVAMQATNALIDALVMGSRERVTAVGDGRTQDAQAAEGYPKEDIETKRRPNVNDDTGVSNHCGGEAIDVTFPFVFNYYDPIIDAVAAHFGLYRPVKDSKGSPEHWHYERLGVPIGNRTAVEPTLKR